MIESETNPLQLANLAKGRMRHKIPELDQALTGTIGAHHAQLAKSMLCRLQLVELALAELDAAAMRCHRTKIRGGSAALSARPVVGTRVGRVGRRRLVRWVPGHRLRPPDRRRASGYHQADMGAAAAVASSAASSAGPGEAVAVSAWH
jgi:hypothetical protein